MDSSQREMRRRALVDRWRELEDEENDLDDSLFSDAEFRRHKEKWFSDAFNFLIKLPEETHIWCGYEDVMWPLLEPFCSYFECNEDDQPIKVLWKRICGELRRCTQCIVQHHKAQKIYSSEFEQDTVKPLLVVLKTLDETRVAAHLRDINARAERKELDTEKAYAEVVSVLFEVLMFPDLLDDQAISNEFVPFLIEVEKSHDLTLAGNQQYPGVYALLFLRKTEARAIGFRLARFLGKLRNAADVEPIQPLLNKCIHFLDNSLSDNDTMRLRTKYEREPVWLGFKSLIGFLESAAFEEGIVERYPLFISVVLNYVSDDTARDFTHAVDCLKLLFEVLGCKLWLKTTFSPAVMRNTLLGQCFHTCIEKHHKAIFDLFQPFLQSLEALQDGELERQRRHFLYFLLHQVSHSRNFSLLMQKKACQVAISIIGRGYRMDPPCPPFECAHMWGPSLIRSVMDSSLYLSLRQPAFDLIQTIIVADAAALVSLWAKRCNQNISFVKSPYEIDGDDDELNTFNEVEEADVNCWSDFNVLGRLTSRGCEEWSCIPLLWVDVLSGISPSVLPLSFSKSVLWALSKFSVIEPEIGNSVTNSMSQWVSMYFEKIGTPVMWDTPKGCDDGADGRGSTNSVKASPQCVDLLRLMRRCGACYASKIEGSELCKQWTWEPGMSETLILLLMDPDDTVRQAGKIILEQVSNARGLVNGLQFLCSSQASISSMLLGLRYAIKMLMADSIISTSRILHLLFFVVSKVLTSGSSNIRGMFSEESECQPSTYSQNGGFLQPLLYTAPSTSEIHRESSNERNEKACKKFCETISENIWPLLLKCLTEGKHAIQEKFYQMTFVRVLEILPLIIGHMNSFQFKQSLFHEVAGNLSLTTSRTVDAIWFNDLIDWGKSQLIVIRRHWKQAVSAILKTIKDLSSGPSLKVISTMETMVASDNLVVDELRKQLSSLSILLSAEDASKSERQRANQPCKSVDEVSCKEDDVVEIIEQKTEHEVIVLSDDEDRDRESCITSKTCEESEFQQRQFLQMENSIQVCEKLFDSQSWKPNAKNNIVNVSSVTSANVSCSLGATIHSTSKSAIYEPPLVCDSSDNRGISVPHPGSMKVDVPVSTRSPPVIEHISSAFPSISSVENVDGGQIQGKSKTLLGAVVCGTDLQSHVVRNQNDNSDDLTKKSSMQKVSLAAKSSEDLLLRELVCDRKDDPLEVALDVAKTIQSLITKPAATTKRQLIHLQAPLENDKGSFERLHAGMKKYKPPRLDEWYKPILELDYFSVVGISLSDTEPENLSVDYLAEVPTSFLSPDHYMNVFRPLVLEEFKAQLRRSFEEVTSPEEICCGTLRLLSLEKVDDFQLVRFMSEAGEDAASRGCSENDLVLLSRQPFQTMSQNVHMIGKVERRERDTKSRSTILVLRLYLHSGIIRLAKARRLLIDRSKWFVTRLMSITPQLREFQALSAVRYLPLLPVILNPYTAALGLTHIHSEAQASNLILLPEPLKECLMAAFNESQLKAISVVLEQNDLQGNSGLSLIQGPPGTGKTRTILAIVSVFLARSKASSNVTTKRNFSSKGIATSCASRGKKSVSQSVAVARSWQDAALATQLMKDTNKSVSKPFRMEGSRRARVLVCAQSNAAVDELVSRIIKHGLYDINGQTYKPYIVRVGNVKTLHPDSLSVFIDTLVDQRLGDERQNETDSRDDEAHNLTAMLRNKLEKLVDKIRLYEDQSSRRRDEQSNKSSIEDDGTCKDADGMYKSEADLKARLNILYKQKRGICTELAAAEAKEKKGFEDNKVIKRDLRRAIIREAEIVVTTLSSCGGDIYSACIESASWNRNGKVAGDALFDVVVIDEAAQALEPATLIPLQLLKPTSGKCVMVGDPKQLPATVLSQLASKFSYECSMFERLQRSGYPVTMLSTQYRMHPEICRFPSSHFYDNQLKDGGSTESSSASFHENFYLGPYMFYDVVDGYEESGRSIRSQSLCNESEVEFALEILRFLKLRYPLEFLPGRIGIITPYKQQLTEIRLRIAKEFGPSIAGDMEFNTVDGFQGREMDILIFSTVRASSQYLKKAASKSGSIGFVADVRRMNVALTRAKYSLWIIGNARTLQQSPHWAALLKNTKERNLLVSVKKPYKSIFCGAQSNSSVKQASAKHLHDQSKISCGQKKRQRLKKDSGEYDAGILENGPNQMCQVKEGSHLSLEGRMEIQYHSSVSGNQEYDRLHRETNVRTSSKKCGKLSDDSLGNVNENNGGKTQKAKNVYAKRKLHDRNEGKPQSRSAINRTDKSDNSTKSGTENHYSRERNDKASVPEKSKPQANQISKEKIVITEKGKHLLENTKYDTKNTRVNIKPNQSNAGHVELREANTVTTSKGQSLQQNIHSSGEPSGELCGQSRVVHNVKSRDELIAVRKRQRDAVNAILPSGAFISSKKQNVLPTALHEKSTSTVNALTNSAEKLPTPRQDSRNSIPRISEKSKVQLTQKSKFAQHQTERAEISSQQNLSSMQDQLSEEWERFEKKLAESKTALQLVKGSPTEASKLQPS